MFHFSKHNGSAKALPSVFFFFLLSVFFEMKQWNFERWNIQVSYVSHFRNDWYSIIFSSQKGETYNLNVSPLVSCFISQKFHVSILKTQWERESAPIVFLFFSLSVFLYETMKLKVKHSSYMFHLSKWLIFNYFERWNI